MIFRLFFVVIVSSIFCPFLSNAVSYKSTKDDVVIENQLLKVQVNQLSGCFTVTEKQSAQVWTPDPWKNAAGLLTLVGADKKEQTLNISKSQRIEVSLKDKNILSINFINPIFQYGSIANDVIITSELRLVENSAQLDVEVTKCTIGKFRLISLSYPSRQFSLETDVDKGAAVVPQKQGVICPSYIFPMNGGRFCKWDDATYTGRSFGTLAFYGNGTGLSMPWFGTYNEKSAVVGILDVASTADAKMEFNINNNGQYLFSTPAKFSNYKRIVFLNPVWMLNKSDVKREISYRFLPKGNYVDMAKEYKKEAIKRGYYKALTKKAEENPNVKKLAGAVYIGIYGGYPHYINMPGMAFNFDELKEMIKVTHDDLKVENAFIHAWGTFSNFPPYNWPINEALGGASKLKAATDLAKKFGYLYSSYHAFTPVLENDPKFLENQQLMEKDKDGNIKKVGGRWARVDDKNFVNLAKQSLPKELAVLNQEADITDIAFVDLPDSGRLALAKYLRSFKLVNGTEHGQEQWIPYFDMFEGMTYNEAIDSGIPLASISIKAPLFNLVYHDAIANFGKIQDPNNETSVNGDFRIKTLQNLLFGAGSLIFFSPYEFDGMKDMIKMSNDLVSPVHRKTFFSELMDHQYLSADFKVQSTKFSDGTTITVNTGSVKQKIANGKYIPGYGYEIKYKNGVIKAGHFNLSLSSN